MLQVENKVVEHVAGLFLWAVLAVRGISKLICEGAPLSQTVNRLNLLPRNLKLLYDN